jgi:tRNA G46 methylase TrmB
MSKFKRIINAFGYLERLNEKELEELQLHLPVSPELARKLEYLLQDMVAKSKDKNMALEIGSGKGYHIQDESFSPTIVRSSHRAEADDDDDFF